MKTLRAFAFGICISIACVSVASVAAVSKQAHVSKQAQMGSDLTQQVLLAQKQVDQASSRTRPARLARLQEAASDRRALLGMLMKTDPGQVLTQALPPAIVRTLSPEVLSDIEQEVVEDGTIQAFQVDMPNFAKSSVEYYLQTQTGRRQLHFAKGRPPLLTGTKVRVRGVRLGSDMALASEQSVQTLSLTKSGSKTTTQAASGSTSSTVLPNTLGPQKTLVLLVNFNNDTANRPVSQSEAHRVVFEQTNAFDLENSYGQTSLVGDTTPWMVVPIASTAPCNSAALADAADAEATRLGYVLSNYQRFVYAYPSNTCTFWGLGTLGGLPTRAWVQMASGFNAQVVGHEMGHNFGLYHSQAIDCGDAPIASSGCTGIEYGDWLDNMGRAPVDTWPHFSAFQKERLGWLNAGASPSITSVRNSSQVSIANMEAPASTSSRAIKVANPSSCSAYTRSYYVEKREPAPGIDAFLTQYPQVATGVVVHQVTEGYPDSSFLLDMTPETTSRTDGALVAGTTFTDPSTGVSITPTSVGDGFANVSVQYGAASCVREAPRLDIAPYSQWTAPGLATSFTATITNRDSCACPATSFTVSAPFLPSGWTMSSVQSGSVAPGASTQVVIQPTPPSTAPLGSYSVGLRAASNADPSRYGSSTNSITLTNMLRLSAAPASSVYSTSKGGKALKVAINASVSSMGGGAIAGALVQARITSPTGQTTDLQATSSSSGSAVLTYSLTSTSAKGQYQVSVSATSSGLSGSTSTSFIVQ